MKMKKKNTRPTTIPKDVRPMLVKKFRTRDKTKRHLVLRLPHDTGHVVQCIMKGKMTEVRRFVVDTKQTALPIPVQLSVSFEMAVWFARTLTRKGMVPSATQEKSRRRRFTKKTFASWQDHQATRSVVRQLKDQRITPQPREKLKVILPFICLYDPKQSVGDT